MTDRLVAVFDLDGVLAEYHGFGDGEIGKPLELGIKLAERLHDDGFKIVVQTCRTAFGSDELAKKAQIDKVESWLTAYLPCSELYLGSGKAHGHVYLDDRGVHIPPNWEGASTNGYAYHAARYVADLAVLQG